MEPVVSKGTVVWTFKHDLLEKKSMFSWAGIFSAAALPSGEGQILLTKEGVMMSGSYQVHIKLSQITQLYLGFDELYPAGSVKNLGAFWQPLRIEYLDGVNSKKKIYLVIDYNGMYTTNQQWYDMLSGMLS